MRFLFWNMGALSRLDTLAAIVGEWDVDVVTLAECPHSDEDVCKALPGSQSGPFVGEGDAGRRVSIVSRAGHGRFHAVRDDDLASRRLSIRAFQLDGQEFLLAVLHFPSPRNWKPDDQMLETTNLIDEVSRTEVARRHSRTIVVGDFNMNPFDPGMVGARGLNATMTQLTATAGPRTVQGQRYPYFYNPMWGHFGDRTEGPPGTHYYRSPGHVSYEWNIFDQVLLRPEVLPYFNGELRIVTQVRERSLTTDSRFQRLGGQHGSDHFPIIFSLHAG